LARPRNVLEAFDGPFSAWLGDAAEWGSWRVFLKCLAAVPLEASELDLFRRCAGDRDPPSDPVTESFVVVGRRGRKSATAGLIGCYQALYPAWPRAPGETLRVLIVAVSKDQAAVVRNWCDAILRSRPGLARQIVSCDSESITLKTGVEIRCVANSYRSIRGPTVVCAIFDEVALWRSEESAVPDLEVLRAVKPSMLTVKGAVLIGLSSPHAKRGLLYQKHRDHFGRNGKVLVWQADSATMNPAVDVTEIEEAFRDDPVAARSEYGIPGEGIWFRDDLAEFVDMDLLAGLVRRSPLELPPVGGHRYVIFIDPSGGRGDAFAVCVGHKDKSGYVIDLVRAWPAPFDPVTVVQAIAALAREYGQRTLIGDQYSGEWVVQAFAAEGVAYQASKRSKSEIYLEALPLFARGEVELPDLRPLLVELASLERRTARGGRDSVDHPRGGRDDRANVACGVLVELAGRKVAAFKPSDYWVGPEYTATREWRSMAAARRW
jgi:hypothetical protein